MFEFWAIKWQINDMSMKPSLIKNNFVCIDCIYTCYIWLSPIKIRDSLLCRLRIHQMPQGTYSPLSCAWMSTGTGGEETGPSDRVRDLEHGGGFLVCAGDAGGGGVGKPDDQMLRLIPNGGHQADAVAAGLVCCMAGELQCRVLTLIWRTGLYF